MCVNRRILLPMTSVAKASSGRRWKKPPFLPQELRRTNIVKSLIKSNVFLHAFIKMRTEVLYDAHAIG